MVSNSSIPIHTLPAVILSSIWPLSCLSSEPLNITLLASSDWIYHGLSETGGSSAYGINIDYQLSRSAFIGIEAHDANPSTLRQRHRNVNAYFGFDGPLFDQWRYGVNLKHRTFLSSVDEWDYSELNLQLWHPSGWVGQIDYAPDYYDQSVEAWAFMLEKTQTLGQRSYWGINLGQLVLASGPNAQFAGAKAGFSYRQFTLELRYNWHSRERDIELLDDSDTAEWQVQWAYRWR